MWLKYHYWYSILKLDDEIETIIHRKRRNKITTKLLYGISFVFLNFVFVLPNFGCQTCEDYRKVMYIETKKQNEKKINPWHYWRRRRQIAKLRCDTITKSVCIATRFVKVIQIRMQKSSSKEYVYNTTVRFNIVCKEKTHYSLYLLRFRKVYNDHF